MDFGDVDDAIAAVAHRCWCKRMLEDGWRPAKLFDADRREHDCLRPFGELTPFKRAQIRQRARWEECCPAGRGDDVLSGRVLGIFRQGGIVELHFDGPTFRSDKPCLAGYLRI